MSNQNSVAGFPGGLFAQSITGTTETALTVPVAGVFPSLPSPALAAGTGLWVGPSPDIQGSVLDGHPFRVRLSGKVFTGASSTFTVKLYNVPAAIAAAGTAGTLSNDSVVVASAAATAFTGAGNFLVEAEFLWDSSSLKLTGYVTACQVNGINLAPNAGTAGTMVATTVVTTTYTAGQSVSLLNFIPSFTFGTANAGNIVTPAEFTIERV